jgi:hypothetical protein
MNAPLAMSRLQGKGEDKGILRGAIFKVLRLKHSAASRATRAKPG